VTVQAFSGLTVDFAKEVGRHGPPPRHPQSLGPSERSPAGPDKPRSREPRDRVHRRGAGLRVHVIKPHQADHRDGHRSHGLRPMVPALVIERLTEKKSQGHPPWPGSWTGRDV
jgi:hypothetical protein